MVGRKLLYHRGIDDQFGTYLTDYIEAAICILLAVYLIIKLCLLRKKEERQLSTVAVILILFSISMSAFFGGLTHQFLQKIEPYDSISDGWTWLVIWRFASSFSASLSFGQVLLGQQILAQEGLFLTGKSLKIFYSILTILCIGLFTYCFAMLFHKTDPWSLAHAFIIVYLFTSVEIIMISCAFVKNLKQNCEAISVPNGHDKKENFEQEIIYPTNGNFVKKKRSSLRLDLLMHLIGSILFLAAGVIQFILARQGCADHHHDEHYRCPLPKNFNHNALLHVIITFALFVSFLAELKAIKRRNRIRSALLECHDQCTHSSFSYESSV